MLAIHHQPTSRTGFLSIHLDDGKNILCTLCIPLYTHCVKALWLVFKPVISYTQQSSKENLPLTNADSDDFQCFKRMKIPKLYIPVLDNTHKEILTKTGTVTGDKQPQNSYSGRGGMKGH